jgi:hypothetical protein
MRLLRPLPARVTRPLSWLVLAAWVVSMGVLLQRSYLQASSTNLATDLARYGSQASWRGVYYRDEKIGFTVGQVVATDEGFELQEDGRLQMSLLGATTPAIIKTTARVDKAFALRSFDFSLDPGTGPIQVSGTLTGLELTLAITSGGSTRTETRTLSEPPSLMMSLSRRLASEGLTPGARYAWTMFDPATMRNAPVAVEVGGREVVRVNERPVPAFRVELAFGGLRTTSWITDTGEVVREESPMGLLTVAESAERRWRWRCRAACRSICSRPRPWYRSPSSASRNRATCGDCACGSRARTCRAPTCRAWASAWTATSSS